MDANRCFQVHEKCNMTEEDPTLVLIGGYRGDVGPTQSFKTFRNYEHMKKYFKSSDWWRNAYIYIYIFFLGGGFANYLLTCFLNFQNVSHTPRV